jgi:hypothetical protein
MKKQNKQKTYWPDSHLTFKNIVAWVISLLLTLATLYYFSGVKNIL